MRCFLVTSKIRGLKKIINFSRHLRWLWKEYRISWPDVYLRPCQTSMMERFYKNSYRLLLSQKSFIVDFWQFRKCGSGDHADYKLFGGGRGGMQLVVINKNYWRFKTFLKILLRESLNRILNFSSRLFW